MSDLISNLKDLARWLRGVQDAPFNASNVEAAIERLQSLSDQNRLTGGWRDIESAPKDGSAVLVWSNGDPSIASFDGQWTALVDGVAVTETTPNTGLRWWTVYPTHWQPLPSPPLPLPGGEEKR